MAGRASRLATVAGMDGQGTGPCAGTAGDDAATIAIVVTRARP